MKIVKNGREFASEQEYIKFLETQLAEQNNRTVTIKVAEESGAISFYGVQNQRPVTLYSTQWERVIETATGVKLTPEHPLGKFIAVNSKYLAQKEDSTEQAAAKLSMRKAEAHGVVAHPKNGKAATA